MEAGVQVELVDGPLGVQPPGAAPPAGGRCGAVLAFTGVVRGLEGGRPLRALRYEGYEPMTGRLLHGLAAAVVAEFGLHAARVEHSLGEVAVGEASFRLTLAVAHRPETLAATAAFIDRMKADVPLWKVPVFA